MGDRNVSNIVKVTQCHWWYWRYSTGHIWFTVSKLL